MQQPELVRQVDAISAGFQRSQILFTALRANVFSHLEEARTAEEVASALDWSPRGTRMLLDGLVALELLRKDNGRYQNGDAASQCLVPGAPLDQTHILTHKANGWNSWAQLGEVVRTGEGLPRKPRSEDQLRAFICGMNDIAKESAKGMVEAIDLSRYRHVLDVGGGPASYSIAFLKAHPEMRATVFDMPEVVPIGREQAKKACLADRIDFVPGDLTTDPLGAGYDLVLISNIIHSFSGEMNRTLVQKSFDALEPGGMLIIKDFLLDAERTGPAFSLIFALHMLLHTEGGDTYTVDEVGGWTQDAGFAPGELADLTPQTRLWLAKKP